jgi:SAM-dependent methyltransferase
MNVGSSADMQAVPPPRHEANMDTSRQTEAPVPVACFNDPTHATRIVSQSVGPDVREPNEQRIVGLLPEAQRDHRRIISLSMVKNEQDIIEPFIRHNSRFVDCMIIVDNASVDETRRIAMDCARELGNVIIADCEGFSYTQAERMTGLLRSCTSAFFPDYVVFLDADEFLGATDRGGLLTTLERIVPGGVGLMPWQTFVVTPDQAPTNDPLRTMSRRRRAESPAYHKVVLRSNGTYRADLRMTQGNHEIMTVSGERLPTMLLDDLPLLHFPVRSREQLVGKGIVGWMACLVRDPNAYETGLCFQWREAFERVVSDRTSVTELAEISMRYAQSWASIDWDLDSVAATPPPNYDRRYSTGAFGDPLVVVARSWERSLSPGRPLLQLHRPPGSLDSAGITATAFDAAWHWDHLFVDLPPFRFIAEKNQPTSVLDIGCGVGAYLALFKRIGATRVVGIDGVPAMATVLAEDEYIVMDLSLPLCLGCMFDLVVCTEVVEHLSAADADVVLESIVRHAGHTIIFSAAEPGQDGHGHINCQPVSYWLERLARLGWYPDLPDSLGIRALATMSWFRRNLIVLRQGESQAGTEAIAVLTAIGARSFNWYGQLPGIREFPFLEDFPPPPAGYLSERDMPV